MARVFDPTHASLLSAALPLCDRYGLAVCGGYAVKAHGLVSRPSEDIDFATLSPAPMSEIADALASAYQAAGYAARVTHVDGRKGHVLVDLKDGASCRVDVIKEPLNRPIVNMDFGPVVALEDVVAMKAAALCDRGLPRDLIDVHAARRHFGTTELTAMARRMLDDEFSLEGLRDNLEFAIMLPPEEFELYGLDPVDIAAMKRWAQEWADEIGLDMAETELWSDDQ